MAKADQLKMLIKSHFDKDSARFSSIALQVAAHEARLGHLAVARDIRDLVDRGKTRNIKILPLNRDLEDLVKVTEADFKLNELIVPNQTADRIKRILLEFRQQHKLKEYGMQNRRKLLITGPPGTGKTMSAGVLAHELSLPLYTIAMDKLMSKYMGETGAKLRQVFDMIADHPGVYLFDEFDAIGSERQKENDVGEMRRVLNLFLQFIEQDQSKGLIVAATNSPMVLDQALFRRFDDVLHYQRPQEEEIKRLIENRLGGFKAKKWNWKDTIPVALKLSHAEITLSCEDAIKDAILSDKKTVSVSKLQEMFKDRHAAYHPNLK